MTLMGEYAAMERARQFLLSAGAESLAPAPVQLGDAEPGLHYQPESDSFTLGEGPARVANAQDLAWALMNSPAFLYNR